MLAYQRYVRRKQIFSNHQAISTTSSKGGCFIDPEYFNGLAGSAVETGYSYQWIVSFLWPPGTVSIGRDPWDQDSVIWLVDGLFGHTRSDSVNVIDNLKIGVG